jgi:hypothetical protein
MKNILKLASFVLGFSLFAATSYAQTALTQTTLSALQTGGPAGQVSGLTNNYSTTIALASATGIQTAFNGQPITYVYVGSELEGILTTVPGSTTIFNVLRGQWGTKVSAHPTGDMVLAQVVTPQFGGFQGSGGFQTTDPPYNGACLATATNVTPWVNVLTGEQFTCSSVTGTWVSSWGIFASIAGTKATATVPSVAGALLPSGLLFEVSGALAITSFSIPVGFNATAVGGGQFCMIPTGTFTTTATNNIAKASTAVVGQLLCETWDPTQLKFVASY